MTAGVFNECTFAVGKKMPFKFEGTSSLLTSCIVSATNLPRCCTFKAQLLSCAFLNFVELFYHLQLPKPSVPLNCV